MTLGAANSTTEGVFDCNCALGSASLLPERAPCTAADLLAEMDRFGISEALVYHNLAREHDPAEGNSRLLREVQRSQRLQPCWVLVPYQAGEIAAPKDLLCAMQDNGVQAVRVFPGRRDHRFPLRPWAMDELLGMLQECRVPLLVDYGAPIEGSAETIDWDGLAEVCARYQGLRLILMGVGFRATRCLIPFMQGFCNVHLDTSAYFVHRGLELLCRCVGSDRLLFGSRLPRYAAGAPLTVLMYAELSQTERSLIWGGNLRRLLSEVAW